MLCCAKHSNNASAKIDIDRMCTVPIAKYFKIKLKDGARIHFVLSQ